jgi:hypothetical protein
MILPWIYDYNTKKLTLTVNKELSYEALDGGDSGYIKVFKGVTTTIDRDEDWTREKYWISENYQDLFGEFKTQHGEFMELPNGDKTELDNGACPDGTRLDHLQRPTAVMTCLDMAEIFVDGPRVYETPDRGLTIYFRPGIKAEYTNYIASGVDNGTGYWREVPQPCHMQPKIQGRGLSSYTQLELAGCPKSIIAMCKKGEWLEPERPDLQKLYVYPKK